MAATYLIILLVIFVMLARHTTKEEDWKEERNKLMLQNERLQRELDQTGDKPARIETGPPDGDEDIPFG